MDETTRRILGLLDSSEYKESAEKAGELGRKIALSNRFQVDALFSEAGVFFATLREERPDIYSALAIKEKEIHEAVIRIKTGKGIVLD